MLGKQQQCCTVYAGLVNIDTIVPTSCQHTSAGKEDLQLMFSLDSLVSKHLAMYYNHDKRWLQLLWRARNDHTHHWAMYCHIDCYARMTGFWAGH